MPADIFSRAFKKGEALFAGHGEPDHHAPVKEDSARGGSRLQPVDQKPPPGCHQCPDPEILLGLSQAVLLLKPPLVSRPLTQNTAGIRINVLKTDELSIG